MLYREVVRQFNFGICLWYIYKCVCIFCCHLPHQICPKLCNHMTWSVTAWFLTVSHCHCHCCSSFSSFSSSLQQQWQWQSSLDQHGYEQGEDPTVHTHCTIIILVNRFSLERKFYIRCMWSLCGLHICIWRGGQDIKLFSLSLTLRLQDSVPPIHGQNSHE